MIFSYIDPGTGVTITTAGGLLLVFFSGMLSFFLVFFKKIFRFFKKHKKFFGIFLLIIILLSGGYYYLMNKNASDFDKKIIILGMDALSPQIMEEMMQAGRLPHFKSLQSTGSYSRLETTNPPQSPVAWTGFATGQNPGKNGVFDFITRNPKDYRIRLALSHIENNKVQSVIKTPRFWEYSSQKKVPTVILGCPMTFPPDKVYGKMISGMGVPDILGTEGTFSFYTSQKEDKADKDIGGKVFHIKKSSLILTHLTGPKVQKGKETDNIKVPLKIMVTKDSGVVIEFQKNKIDLQVGQWSGWQEVTFNAGLFKKVKGIFKFFLLETDPEFKLYMTPINIDPRQPFYPISYPKSYSKELVENIGFYHTQGMPFDTWALNEKRIDEKIFMDNVHEILSEKKALLDLELNQFEKGIFFMYFESADIVQHMFWRYIDEEHPLYEKDAPSEYKDMIWTWYEKMDKILGGVLERIDDEDTLIVLSDHGFNTFRRAAHVNTWLRDNGYLELEDPTALKGNPLLTGVDWGKTKAYAVGFGGIYINEKGRESQGIVAPGQEKEKLKVEISQKLEEWFDSKYQEKVVHNVYKQEEVFWGAHQADTPDLLIGYQAGYRASWQTALGDIPKNDMEDNLKKWSGSHLFDASLVKGVLFSNKKIIKDNPSILDITPSILKIIGYEKEEIESFDFDGENLFNH